MGFIASRGHLPAEYGWKKPLGNPALELRVLLPDPGAVAVVPPV